VIAKKAGLTDLMRVFLSHLRFRLDNEGEMLLLAHLSVKLGDMQSSVRIGKTAIEKGFDLVQYAYPTQAMPAFSPLRKLPEQAIFYAIARQESEFNTLTVSGAGAKGILQVMPVTARHVCQQYKIKCELSRLATDPAYNAKLATAQKAEAELLRKQRELDDARREMDLTIEKRVTEGLGAVETRARQRADEDARLRMAETDKVIGDMTRQVEEMKRKMEQGSQQLQGEVQELELEAFLRARFPRDTIEPVAKGEHGGDALHRVLGPLGQACGTILWESKRTKNWSDGWLVKLRDDQRAAKAEIAILVSQALPREVETFDQIDGVWVTSPRCAIPLALALRHSLTELAAARQAGEGQQTKMEMVYQYLTGPRFRQRIQAIVEKFGDMQEDLEKERRAMTRQWAKREEQIRSAIDATAGMYGDLQGIAGRTLQQIEGLDVRMLGDAGEST
jgi:hypothetical protein